MLELNFGVSIQLQRDAIIYLIIFSHFTEKYNWGLMKFCIFSLEENTKKEILTNLFIFILMSLKEELCKHLHYCHNF